MHWWEPSKINQTNVNQVGSIINQPLNGSIKIRTRKLRIAILSVVSKSEAKFTGATDCQIAKVGTNVLATPVVVLARIDGWITNENITDGSGHAGVHGTLNL